MHRLRLQACDYLVPPIHFERSSEFMKERLKKVTHRNRDVLIIDYTNLKEPGLIEIVAAARDLIIKENKPVLVLGIFNAKTYASPKFIRFLENALKEVDHLITKNAVTGISDVQRWIVKGINLWYKNKLHPFDSVDKALDFLARD